MNANELADALDNLGHNYTNQTEIVIKSATMLRQQQAENEALKKDRNRIMEHQRKIIFWLETNHPTINEQLGKTISTGVLK